MARERIAIDRDKLRAAIRKLGPEYVFYMLDDAIDLLSPAKLHKIAGKYLDLRSLRPEGNEGTKANLLADVKAFEKASWAGEYYESFSINSRNCTEQSAGTTAGIAECRRLLGRCVAEAKKSNNAAVQEAFDILFGLLDCIDEGNDDVIFFADEGGSWQAGVDWDKVLPLWFKVLSATTAPERYAERITFVLERHYNHGRDVMLAVAGEIATSDQRRALADAPDRHAGRRRGGTQP